MDQAGEHEPVGMTVGADRLRGLQQVLELGEAEVGIGVVDQRVEERERVPHAHALALEPEELALLGQHEVVALMAVVEPVELADGVARGLVVVAVVLARLGGGGTLAGRRIALEQEVLPLVEAAQRSRVAVGAFLHGEASDPTQVVAFSSVQTSSPV